MCATCATLIHTCAVTIGLACEDTLCMFGIWHSVVCIWGKFVYLGVCIWYLVVWMVMVSGIWECVFDIWGWLCGIWDDEISIWDGVFGICVFGISFFKHFLFLLYFFYLKSSQPSFIPGSQTSLGSHFQLITIFYSRGKI